MVRQKHDDSGVDQTRLLEFLEYPLYLAIRIRDLVVVQVPEVLTILWAEDVIDIAEPADIGSFLQVVLVQEVVDPLGQAPVPMREASLRA